MSRAKRMGWEPFPSTGTVVRRRMTTTRSLALWLLAASTGIHLPAAADALLSRDATYTIRSYSHGWPNQAVPGTGQWIDEPGFYETPFVAQQDTGRILIDGVKRRPSVLSTWFWGSEQKRVVVEFDLHRPARIGRVSVFLNDEAQGALAERIEVSVKQGEQWQSYAVTEVAPDEEIAVHEVALTGDAIGRLVRVTLSSVRSPYIALSEIEVWGERQADLPEQFETGFVRTWPARDAEALTRVPDLPEGSSLRAWAAAPSVVGQLEAGADDPGALSDGAPETFIAGAESPLTITVALEGPALLDRVAVWVAPTAPGGPGYLNIFALAVGGSAEGPFVPLAERAQNPVYPRELDHPYRVVSPDLKGAPASAVRIEVAFWHLNAPRVRLGGIEVWGRSASALDVASQPAWELVRETVEISPEPLGEPESHYDWVLAERVRGGYTGFYDLTPGLLGRCKRNGLNTLLIHIFGDAIKGANFAAQCVRWGEACRDRGLHFIAEIAFGADDEYGNTQFGAFSPGNATEWVRTPCPLSADYWENVVAQRALAAARIGAKGGVDGFCIDMEMYGADETRYPGPCFCEACFAGFLKEFVTGLAADDVEPETRLAWAKANGLAELYARRQEREVQRICAGIERRVHEIDPRMILATLLIPEPLRGISRGLGTPNRPILVFEERTYWGDVSGCESVRAALEANYPALYVPGFWFQPVGPDRLAPLSKAAATQAYGYWYFTLYSLRPDQAELPGDYALPEPWSVDDYWDAIREAGRETDRALAEGRVSDPVGNADGPRAELPLRGPTPELDGVIDDDEWRGALQLGPFRLFDKGESATVASYARILSDGEFLFVAAEFDEPRMDELVHTRTVRDDVLLWRDDCLEIFVAPDAEAQVYYQFIINPDAVIYDSRCHLVGEAEPVWDSAVKAASGRGPDGWTLEVAIPLADISPRPPRAGDVWRLNICREQRVPPGEVSCAWPTFGPFHQPARFAELVWK